MKKNAWARRILAMGVALCMLLSGTIIAEEPVTELTGEPEATLQSDIGNTPDALSSDVPDYEADVGSDEIPTVEADANFDDDDVDDTVDTVAADTGVEDGDDFNADDYPISVFSEGSDSCVHANYRYKNRGVYGHDVHCADCGLTIRWADAHSYDGSVCVCCGYDRHFADGCVDRHIVSCVDKTVCMRTGEEVYNEETLICHGATPESDPEYTYASNGVSSHSVFCKACGETQDFGEQHTLNNGVCEKCGIHLGCADGCSEGHTVSCDNPTVCLMTGETVQGDEYVDVKHGTLETDYEWTVSYTAMSEVKHIWHSSCTVCGEDRIGCDTHLVTCDDLTCVCGYTVAEDNPEIAHDYGGWNSVWRSSAKGHWEECLECGAPTPIVEHSNYNGDSLCDTCGWDLSGVDCYHKVYCYAPNDCYICGAKLTEDDDPYVEHDLYCKRLDDDFHQYVCEDCGYVDEVCPHDQEITDFNHIDEYGHAAMCSYCGGETYEPHVLLRDGSCGRCGYGNGKVEVGHIFDGMLEVEEIYFDSGFHWKYCPHCGEEVVEPHEFGSGECWTCGYASVRCKHKTQHATYETSYELTSQPENPRYHWLVGMPTLEVHCSDCVETIRAERMEPVRKAEEHSFTDSGICSICGYKRQACDHSETETVSYIGRQEMYAHMVSSDAQGHHYAAPVYEEVICKDCGAKLDVRQAGTTEVVTPHYVDSFSATVCECMRDYNDAGELVEVTWEITCPHTNTHIEKRRDESISYGLIGEGDMDLCAAYPMDANSHEMHLDMRYMEICDACGVAVCRDDLTMVDFTVTEPHSFVGNVCVDCGYIQEKPEETPTPTPAPTAAPTAAPTVTPTPAPVYTEVASDEAVHGVKAEDATPMVETLLAVVEALETRGEVTAVEIMNVGKLLLPGEERALEALPLREQLLTFLSVIGFEGEVRASLEASEIQLSPEAEALKMQIQARMDAMDAAARAEFEAVLSECFLRESVIIDDVEYSYFALELKVDVEGEIHCERYGFRLEGDEWIFTRLEIGK